MTIKMLLEEGKEKLSHNNIENPVLNIGIILEEVTGIKRLSLPLYYDKELSYNQIEIVNRMINRRCNHEPLQYILGYTEFYGCKILVNSDVLIPRPETEYLLETIRNHQLSPQRILDIGTGSGAIAISLKKIYPQAQVVAVDVSPKALAIAKKNAKENHVIIDFIQANIYKDSLGKFDIIVSNPPYISEKDYTILPLEVKEYEPKLALVGSESGLYFYRKIIEMSKIILTNDGLIFFEIGQDQADEIIKIALSNKFKDVNIIKDLVGRNRIAYLVQ